MPDDANGNFSLVSGYLAVTGQTIQPSQHNPVFEDIAPAMTARLSRSGVAPMTGPLKTITGSASAPAISPNSNPAIGIYWTATGIAFAGTVAGVRFIGELIPYTFLTPEPLTVLPYGQTLLRASYPDLWAKAQTDIAAGNTFYNNGNGITTFGIGDLRGRVIAGKDNMGGTAAGRMTTAGAGVDGTTLGAAGGSQTVVLTVDQLAQHQHSGTTGGMTRNNPHNHLSQYSTQSTSQGVPTGNTLSYYYGNVAQYTNFTDIEHEHNFTTNWGNSISNAPHSNTQPTMACNYLLYAGA